MIEQLTEAAIARHTNPWEWIETRLAALSDAAQLVGAMSPTMWGREIVRLSRQLNLDLMTVQAEVLHAGSRADNALMRVGAHEHRDDLDGGQLIAHRPADFASDSYPHPMTTIRAEAPPPGVLRAADNLEIGMGLRVGGRATR